MYLLGKIGSHKSYGDRDVNSYISFYMNTLEKTELNRSTKNTNLQFRSPGPGLQKKREEERENEEHKQLSALYCLLILT